MTKLSMSYAILALESLGYEQANNKPLSFGRRFNALTVSCRLSEVEGVIYGAFTLSVTVEAETLQSKLSVPVLVAGDIRKAELGLFEALTVQLEEQSELALIAYKARALQLTDLSSAISLGVVATVAANRGR